MSLAMMPTAKLLSYRFLFNDDKETLMMIFPRTAWPPIHSAPHLGKEFRWQNIL